MSSLGTAFSLKGQVLYHHPTTCRAATASLNQQHPKNGDFHVAHLHSNAGQEEQTFTDVDPTSVKLLAVKG